MSISNQPKLYILGWWFLVELNIKSELYEIDKHVTENIFTLRDEIIHLKRNELPNHYHYDVIQFTAVMLAYFLDNFSGNISTGVT